MASQRGVRESSCWGAILTAALALGACTVQEPSAEDDVATAGSMGGGAGGSAGDIASSPGGTGGSTVSTPGGTGGSGNLEQCGTGVIGNASVNDATGSLATTGASGKVTVTSIEETPSEALEPPGPMHRSYALHGDDGDWTLDAEIPGLTSELIQVGDVLDFRLETSVGYIPFTSSQDQTFGLFADDGSLLLFGAHRRGLAVPVPDLSMLGLSIEDQGARCTSQLAPICLYVEHQAHFSADGAQGDLQPRVTQQIGKLHVTLTSFEEIAGGSGCDDSGRAMIVGAATSAP